MTQQRKILVRSDLEELSREAANLFVDFAQRSFGERDRFAVALSGGSTPRTLHTILSSDAYRETIDWRSVKFFFGDERNVPADSPDSNYRMAYETLLEPLGIGPDQAVRWRTEIGPELAAEEYQKELRANGPLDLVILGLGSDAHTASLFPNTPALKESDLLATVNWIEKLNEFRLTMTFPAINQANVMFLVAGCDKAQAVVNVIEGDDKLEEFPAQGVRPHGKQIHWLLDQPAAGLLVQRDNLLLTAAET